MAAQSGKESKRKNVCVGVKAKQNDQQSPVARSKPGVEEMASPGYYNPTTAIWTADVKFSRSKGPGLTIGECNSGLSGLVITKVVLEQSDCFLKMFRGDRILTINDVPVRTKDEMKQLLQKPPPVVGRDASIVRMKMIRERPETRTGYQYCVTNIPVEGSAVLGLAVRQCRKESDDTTSSSTAARSSDCTGGIVARLAEGSIAGCYLQLGDLIVEVNGVSMTLKDQIKQEIAVSAARYKRVQIGLERATSRDAKAMVRKFLDVEEPSVQLASDALAIMRDQVQVMRGLRNAPEVQPPALRPAETALTNRDNTSELGSNKKEQDKSDKSDINDEDNDKTGVSVMRHARPNITHQDGNAAVVPICSDVLHTTALKPPPTQIPKKPNKTAPPNKKPPTP